LFALLGIGIATQHLQHRAIIGADIGHQLFHTIFAGLFDEDIEKLGADALLLKIIANCNGNLSNAIANANVADASDGDAALLRQIHKGQKARALTVTCLRQSPRFFQNAHGTQVGDRLSKTLIQAFGAEPAINVH